MLVDGQLAADSSVHSRLFLLQDVEPSPTASGRYQASVDYEIDQQSETTLAPELTLSFGQVSITVESTDAAPGETAQLTITFENQKAATDFFELSWVYRLATLTTGLTPALTSATPECGSPVIETVEDIIRVSDLSLTANSTCELVFDIAIDTAVEPGTKLGETGPLTNDGSK